MSDELIELKDAEGNVIAAVEPAEPESEEARLAAIQAEYDRVLGPGAVQVVGESDPLEEPVNDDGNGN